MLQLQENVDKSQLCIRNPDDKFLKVIERKGKFLDQSGECIKSNNIIACYDNRLLPLPTIRHSNCLMFVNRDSQRCNINCFNKLFYNCNPI